VVEAIHIIQDSKAYDEPSNTINLISPRKYLAPSQNNYDKVPSLDFRQANLASASSHGRGILLSHLVLGPCTWPNDGY
jgi:hypothetical protein